MFIDEGNGAQIQCRTDRCFTDIPHRIPAAGLCAVRNAGDITQCRRPFTMIIVHQFQEGLLPFAAHDARNSGVSIQHLPRIVGHFRAAQPDLCLRQDLLDLPDQLFHIADVPQIAGDTQNIRTAFIDIHEDLINRLVDRVFRDPDLFFVSAAAVPARIGAQTVHGGIGMDVFCINGC